MKNRGIKNIFCFMVALLVIFARPSATALPLFNGDGSLTEGSKYLCQILEIDDKVTNAQQFTEFFEMNFLDNAEEEFYEKRASIIKFDENTPEKLFEKLLKAFKLLGMKQDVLPKKAKYDYVIISSSQIVTTCQFVRSKMVNIIGNNPNTKIFFITSQRLLDLSYDPMAYFIAAKELEDKNLLPTERYAAQLIWEQELGEYHFPCEFVDCNRSEVQNPLQAVIESLDLAPGAMVVVSYNPYIALLDNGFQNFLGHRWFEYGGTLETVGFAGDLIYDDIINNAEDQRIRHEVCRNTIWLYISIITNCAIEEFKQLTVGN
ncbi:MAG: hypothetical protein LBK24_02430 [Puniceicoccales bacterium]|jgi:hypothetical protein|nr:hypothetical protein [Puniceicoccales bacterium]